MFEKQSSKTGPDCQQGPVIDQPGLTGPDITATRRTDPRWQILNHTFRPIVQRVRLMRNNQLIALPSYQAERQILPINLLPGVGCCACRANYLMLGLITVGASGSALWCSVRPRIHIALAPQVVCIQRRLQEKNGNNAPGNFGYFSHLLGT